MGRAALPIQRREVNALPERMPTVPGPVLCQVREGAGVRLRRAAQVLHLDASTLSRYERGRRRLPLDMAEAAAETLPGGVAIRLQACAGCRVGFFRLPVLAGVDRHPVAAVAKLAEEMEEAARAAREIERMLLHREDDRERLEAALEQVLDLLPAAAVSLIAVTEAAVATLPGIRRRWEQKAAARGYLAPATTRRGA